MFNLQKKQAKKYLSVGIPILVFLGIAWRLSGELTANYFEQTYSYLDSIALDFVFLILVIVCSVLNWSFEALKWKELIRPIENVSFFKSIRSVLAGLSIGFFTPHSIGDYFGRTMLLDSVNRFQVLGGLLVSRVFQMLATVLVGIWGVFYLRDKIERSIEVDFVLYLSASILCLMVVLFIIRKMLIQMFLGFKQLKAVVNLFEIIKNYKSELYSKILVFSFFRYCSFLLQFILVAMMLNVSFSMLPFLAVVSAILLFKSLVVSFNFFSDLGMRELGSVMLFPLIEVSTIEGLSIGLFVWLFNVLFPSLIGSLMIWKAKW